MARLKVGDWNAICDVCGFKFKASELRKRWDGLYVCTKDWEQRHESDLLRVKPEKITPPWVRPEPDDTFLNVCDIWTTSPMADFGTADCMRVGGNTSIPILIELFYPVSLAVADTAIADFSLANNDFMGIASAPAPAPAPSGSPALKFNFASNSMYLPLRSVGGM